MKNEARVQNLFGRYMEGSIQGEEKAELSVLVSKMDDAAISNLLKQSWEEHPQQIPVFSEAESASMLEHILKKGAPPTQVFQLPRRFWAFLAAASVLALAMFTGWYYFMKPASTADQQALAPVRHERDLNPGGNKALLTLADGSTIILDNAPTGKLTEQGKTQILKLGDGQLAYTPTAASGEVLYNTVATPRGGQFQLSLADGTRVWLNSSSSIRFPAAFAGKERKVEITGEAYFEVAKNTAQPFRVDAGGKFVVEVMGTQFNVNAYSDESESRTTLLEGKVRISTPEGKEVSLEPNQQARIAGNRLRVAESVDTDEAVAWKTGWFMFDRTDLPGIMRQISRWYDVDVEFEGKIDPRSFSGIVNRNNKVSEVLKIMENAGVRFRIEKDRIVVIP
ncbi:MAG: FecR domain-containing protein [Saprospiraceae bacterium]|nr:FecR domain-containing protein [Saprospiraceae bacterium]